MCREKGGGESYLQSGQTHFTSDKCLFEGEKRKEKQGGRKEGNGKKKREPGLIRGSWVVSRIFSNNLMKSSAAGITPHCNKGT